VFPTVTPDEVTADPSSVPSFGVTTTVTTSPFLNLLPVNVDVVATKLEPTYQPYLYVIVSPSVSVPEPSVTDNTDASTGLIGVIDALDNTGLLFPTVTTGEDTETPVVSPSSGVATHCTVSPLSKFEPDNVEPVDPIVVPFTFHA
jgi:hypothetical protein